MTNEDLSKEYPILLCDYSTEWMEIFETEKAKIQALVGEQIESIFHFGSTAIHGMTAKPTIDILVILKAECDLFTFTSQMIDGGYTCTKYPDPSKKSKNCMNFIQPYVFNGTKQIKAYIHIREKGTPYPEILFCKYLREHADVAKEYIELKKKLACQYRNDRKGYMLAKSEFVEKYTNLAIALYHTEKE